MNKLPAGFIEKGLEIAKDAKLFGVAMTELSDEELLAACAQGWKAYSDHLKESGEAFAALRDMRR